MLKLSFLIKPINKIFFTFKFITRSIAVIIAIFLGMATFVITYKTGADIAIFFNFEKKYLIDAKIIKTIDMIIAIFVSLATVIQSAPIIWERLSYWGKKMDDIIIKMITKKNDFIYLSNKKIKKARKLINKGNAEFQSYIWGYINKSEANNKDQIKYKLNQILNLKISPAIDIYHQVVQILKNNETYDKISNENKYQCDLELNTLINQITQLMMNIINVKYIV